jgi:small neutral amino acid transporter SnatA (MarC family)
VLLGRWHDLLRVRGEQALDQLAGLGVATSDTFSALRLVFGVFLGSAAWWLILSAGASRFSRSIRTGALHAINRVAGIGILLIGSWQLAQLAINPN